jgi:type I restriction enzyme R subunit
MDQVSRKGVRPYQDIAINKALWQFAQGDDRVLLLMATGTGKTFTIFQLVWKLLNGKALKREHVLFLTDRNSLKDQAYRAFSAFSASERVQIDKDTVAQGQHLVGKVFFANYQSLDEDLDGKKVYEHYDPDFFDLVVIDECHRSGFGDWFGVLKHFGGALQLGLTATPRELEEGDRSLTAEEKRRDTQHYFGDPVFTYSLKQAIEDGFLVPYLLEERITNVDEDGYTGPDGKRYTTANFERDIRMPDRTKAIAEDFWEVLGKYELRDEKTIIFCVDDTHAAFMAQELRRLSGNADYAARITRAERNSHQLERNFAVVGPSNPRVAVTVDLLTTGFDAPDVKNIVFVRPLRSAILYKQMKGRGTRLCEDINKRYFTIFDYSGASQLEDAEFDGHRPIAEGCVSQQQAEKEG